ncbi:MAG: 4a-hydroxytetrahydrobiopterin dehydratase [Elusimicrobia bacterium]|nr:4a-hydroxytetrahydrobiopterin dehydratase [Elusimicrobiota bacterium]
MINASHFLKGRRRIYESRKAGKNRCRPCPKGTSPLPRSQARKWLARLAGWKLNEKSKSISKLYIMRDFSAAIAFMKTIHPVAQAEDHHPDLHLTNYRRLRIVLSTQGGWALR